MGVGGVGGGDTWANNSWVFARRPPVKVDQIDKHILGKIFRGQIYRGFIRKYGKPYERDIESLRQLIRQYFTTEYGFNHVEYEENELVFVLLICNTFDKVKSLAKQNKKAKQ